MLRRVCRIRLQKHAVPNAAWAAAQAPTPGKAARSAPSRSSDPAHEEIAKQRHDVTKFSAMKTKAQAEESSEQFTQLLMAEIDKINKENEANEQKGPLKRNVREIQRRYCEARGVPLVHRWWVPWLTIAFTIFIWLPTKWKVSALLWLDHTHDDIKWYIHTTYWKYTMDADHYALLMEQMEAGIQKSKRAPSPDCPL